MDLMKQIEDQVQECYEREQLLNHLNSLPPAKLYLALREINQLQQDKRLEPVFEPELLDAIGAEIHCAGCDGPVERRRWLFAVPTCYACLPPPPPPPPVG